VGADLDAAILEAAMKRPCSCGLRSRLGACFSVEAYPDARGLTLVRSIGPENTERARKEILQTLAGEALWAFIERHPFLRRRTDFDTVMAAPRLWRTRRPLRAEGRLQGGVPPPF
jgi:hypothetical protein